MTRTVARQVLQRVFQFCLRAASGEAWNRGHRRALPGHPPPRSPKLNVAVERAQRAHTEEFYQVYDLPWTATALNQHARQWEQTYNTVRPHQALSYLNPAEFLAQHPRCAPG